MPAVSLFSISPPPISASRRLLHRIQRRYPTVTETLRVGEVSISFTRIAEPDQVLDEVAEEAGRRSKQRDQQHDEPLRMPYWAELWESGLGVGCYLANLGGLEKRSLLDLGCGMGLAGAIAGARGANVLLADIERTALLLARFNTLPWRDRVRVRRVNWQTDRLGERFDLILGADILYERGQWEFLEPFWREHLADGGTVLLGEPGRQTGDQFPAWILDRGWKVKQFEQAIGGGRRAIRMLALSREE